MERERTRTNVDQCAGTIGRKFYGENDRQPSVLRSQASQAFGNNNYANDGNNSRYSSLNSNYNFDYNNRELDHFGSGGISRANPSLRPEYGNIGPNHNENFNNGNYNNALREQSHACLDDFRSNYYDIDRSGRVRQNVGESSNHVIRSSNSYSTGLSANKSDFVRKPSSQSDFKPFLAANRRFEENHGVNKNNVLNNCTHIESNFLM